MIQYFFIQNITFHQLLTIIYMRENTSNKVLNYAIFNSFSQTY